MMQAKLNNDWQVLVVDEKTIGNRKVFGNKAKRNLKDEAVRTYRIWSNLYHALNDSEVKVVHSCIPSVTLAMIREYICACIAHGRKRKFIIHFRCTVPNTTKGIIGHYVLRKLCNISDMIISLNKQSSDYLDTITNTPIISIPNFIAEYELCDSHPISSDIKKVVYIGGIVEDKGIGDILRIANELQDIEFVLVGEGDAVFEEKAKSKNIDNVSFLGAKDREGVKKELLNADAFLFMTYFRGEGFSNALCEAMAAGLPCVATNWAANADMIGDGGGIVVPVGDVSAAVQALKQMQDPQVRMRMSKHNIEKVRTEYIQSVVLKAYVDAYEEILRSK